MKKQLFMIVMLFITGITFAQTDRLWSEGSKKSTSEIFENKNNINNPKIYSLDINGLKNALAKAPERLGANVVSEVIISFPNSDGKMENFKVSENSNFDPQLAAKYPGIKSYVGQGIENPDSTVYFSISPLGLSSMEIYGDKSAVFIEPYTKDLSAYVVYRKSDKKDNLNKFECTVIDVAQKGISNTVEKPNADDAKLRKFRLALSVTGEYTAYFGGTKANALAAMNNTMTRVNGVFEKDFAARMVLIANNDAVIFTNAITDPYSDAAVGTSSANSNNANGWSIQLQNTLTNVIGNAGYDIGHLFGASGGGGNAGCIGCICVDDTTSSTDKNKGSGFTSPSDGIPSGDNFDIDYVAHEFGHQFGGNHTFSHANEETGVNMEPGSGSTIMGYAGITGQDVQLHSDAFFHAISIQQVTNNIKSKACPVVTLTGNAIPTAGAGLDYTIPKGTPFMLTGTGTDADGDPLTYIWEQTDNAALSQTGVNSAAIATKASGPTFRSWTPQNTPVRYFPRMASVLAGATATAGTDINVEALSDVARTLNFRFTVRDNRAGGSGNNSDDAKLTVNATAGPFVVNSQNVATTYTGGTSQTVTWNVAGTTANGVNTANVDILWSTNSGTTWTTLLAGTPNDGNQAVIIPNAATTTGRIMVKGSNHIFFDVNNANITVNTMTVSYCTATATNTTDERIGNVKFGTIDNTSTGTAGYEDFTSISTYVTKGTAYTISITPVWASTVYNEGYAVYIDYNKDGDFTDSGELAWSKTPSQTTLATGTITIPATATSGNTRMRVIMQFNAVPTSSCGSYTYGQVEDYTLNIDTHCTATTINTKGERIGNVKFGTINNTSTGTTGYENFTSVSTNVTTGTAYPISVTPFWTTSTPHYEGYAVYIDYNNDGDFLDSGELAWYKDASKTTPATGSITIPATATSGNTRMRVIMQFNVIPVAPCGFYAYGQVEDYTLNIVSAGKGKSVDVDTKELPLEIKLYPNPVKDILNVSNTDSEEYRIFDMAGKLIKSGKLNRGSVNVSTLTQGAYIIQIGGEVSKRFIKN